MFKCSGVRVFRGVLGVDDILEGQKGYDGGGPKNGQNSIWGKTGHLQEGDPKMAKILGGVKFQHFGPPLRPKKVLLTAEKSGVGPKLTKISRWGENTDIIKRAAQKKAQIQYGVKLDIFQITTNYFLEV